MPARLTLLIGTAKGLFQLTSPPPARDTWKLDGPQFLGQVVQHVVPDPRKKGLLLAGIETGHLGPTVLRSEDAGKTWKEATKPPAFPKAKKGEKGKSVRSVFWLTPGHASTPGRWYAGTIPHGLFVTEDNGDTWSGVASFNKLVADAPWAKDEPPGGPYTHSIMVDPRDARNVLVNLSLGGTLESTDGGKTWRGCNKGCTIDFGPDPNPEFGQDPHHCAMAPSDPDILYQQNHCGIFRMDRREGHWTRIGDNMPRAVGDIGFPVAVHPRDANTAWVFPMDGTATWPRTSPAGKPAIYKTTDGGPKWARHDKGLPRANAYYTVLRHAMKADDGDPVGLYLGTTSGEVWASRDEGASFACLAAHLPRILSIQPWKR